MQTKHYLWTKMAATFFNLLFTQQQIQKAQFVVISQNSYSISCLTEYSLKGLSPFLQKANIYHCIGSLFIHQGLDFPNTRRKYNSAWVPQIMWPNRLIFSLSIILKLDGSRLHSPELHFLSLPAVTGNLDNAWLCRATPKACTSKHRAPRLAWLVLSAKNACESFMH